jgi:hypothetical protein
MTRSLGNSCVINFTPSRHAGSVATTLHAAGVA